MTYQISLPQPLARSKQLITSCPTDNKVLCKIDTTNTVKPTNKRLPGLLIQACHNWRHEERPKPALIQRTGHQVCHGAGTNIAFLAQPVHVDFIAEQIRHCRYVCCETC